MGGGGGSHGGEIGSRPPRDGRLTSANKTKAFCPRDNGGEILPVTVLTSKSYWTLKKTTLLVSLFHRFHSSPVSQIMFISQQLFTYLTGIFILLQINIFEI